jgi:hypothetical protein
MLIYAQFISYEIELIENILLDVLRWYGMMSITGEAVKHHPALWWADLPMVLSITQCIHARGQSF